jgi:hypothetical protein
MSVRFASCGQVAHVAAWPGFNFTGGIGAAAKLLNNDEARAAADYGATDSCLKRMVMCFAFKTFNRSTG